MKKVISGTALALSLLMASAPAYAANNQMKIDGIAVSADVKPEVKSGRTMVPLRVISENLGATVDWSNSVVTITKDDMKITLKPNDSSAAENGKAVKLDVQPYLKSNRILVPLRFIAEAFGCEVGYSNSTVTVDTAPLVIDGVQVKALQEEYHMTMGGVVQQIKVNALNERIYNIFAANKGDKVDAPASYSWRVNIDEPGSYYKDAQYDFLDADGNSVKRFDVYSLIEAFPKVLIYDASEDQWYLFNETAASSVNSLVETAAKNGSLTVISNTVA